MEFDWDPKKAKLNLNKHGVDFDTAAKVFEDPLALTIPDNAHSVGEERWVTLGQASPKQFLIVVVHTYRGEDDQEIIRIISARRATKKEKKQYEG